MVPVVDTIHLKKKNKVGSLLLVRRSWLPVNQKLMTALSIGNNQQGKEPSKLNSRPKLRGLYDDCCNLCEAGGSIF